MKIRHAFSCSCPGCMSGSEDDPSPSEPTPIDPGPAPPPGPTPPLAPKPIYTLSQVTEAMTNWSSDPQTVMTTTWAQNPNGPTQIRYYIPTADMAGPNDFDGDPTMGPDAGLDVARMTATMHDMAVQAFEFWDDLIPLDLVEVTKGDYDIGMAYSTNTTLRSDGTRGTYMSHQYDAYEDHYEFTDARIWLASSWVTLDEPTDIGYGRRGFATYVHEIGHSLGLTHPGSYDAARGPATYAVDADFVQDTRQYTVMSYFGSWTDSGRGGDAGGDGTWSFITEDTRNSDRYPAAPMLYDIWSIQQLYGADLTTRSTNTTYGFGSTAGRDLFNFAINRNPTFAIWDGGGIDTIDVSGFYDASGAGVPAVISLLPGTFSSINGMVGNVAVAYNCIIENAVGGAGDDIIVGNDADNTLTGGDGADTLYGGKGRDTLDGGLGIDTMRGGANDDTYHINHVDDLIIENPGEGDLDTAIVTLSGYVLAPYVEQGIVSTLLGATPITLSGNSLDNTLIGFDGNDSLYGAGGRDTIRGGRGHDYIDGGAGPDTMVGGIGNDRYVVDDVGDTITENAGEGTDTLIAMINARILPTNVENGTVGVTTGLTLTGNGVANTLTGNTGQDRLFGGGGIDTLDGGGGNDYLDGGTEIDTMIGGLGDDTFVVRQLGETLREYAGEGTDTVVAMVSGYTLAANVEHGRISGGGYTLNGNGLNNTLTGDVFADTLNGGGGFDTLHGGGSGDRLNGGVGKDTLYGEGGNDTFVFFRGEAGADTIMDFEGAGAAAGDFIEFRGYGDGAWLTQVDATHWRINTLDGFSETIALATGVTLTTADYLIW